MNVDKFGHHIHKRMRLSELFEINENTLLKSKNGDFDLKTSRLRGIKNPVEADDAVNKDYVDRMTANMIKEFNTLIGTLRSQSIIDARETFQVSLKAEMPAIVSHLQDKFYTKEEVDKLIQKISNGKTANC